MVAGILILTTSGSVYAGHLNSQWVLKIALKVHLSFPYTEETFNSAKSIQKAPLYSPQPPLTLYICRPCMVNGASAITRTVFLTVCLPFASPCSGCPASPPQCGSPETEAQFPAVDLLLLAEGTDENKPEWHSDRRHRHAAPDPGEPKVFAAPSAALGHAQEVHGHRLRRDSCSQ